MQNEDNTSRTSVSERYDEILNKEILIREIVSLIERGDVTALKHYFSESHPAKIAELVGALDRDNFWKVIGIVDGSICRKVLNFIEIRDLHRLIEDAADSKVADLLEILPPDTRVDFFQTFDASRQRELFRFIAEAERKDMVMLLNYEEDTSGALMTTNYVAIQEDYTVESTLRYIRRNAMNNETIYDIYVLDEDKKLVGMVSLRTLIISSTTESIKNIMTKDIISIQGHESPEQAAKLIQKYDLLALPVIESEKKMVGIITVDDVMDFLEEEVTEDFYKLAAAGHQFGDYQHTSVLSITKERVKWLLVLVAVGFLSIYIMNFYHAIFDKMVILTFFIPLLIGAGGNAGAQSSTVTIRGISTGEFSFSDITAHVKKEILVGTLIGLCLGCLLALGSFLIEPNPEIAFKLGLTVSVSALILVVLGQAMGAALPLFCSKMGIDAALLSTPLITGIIDILGIIIYIGFAQLVFNF